VGECLDPTVIVEGRTLLEVKQNLREELDQALKNEEPCIIKGKFLTEEFEN
jgi:hypothetical protein